MTMPKLPLHPKLPGRACARAKTSTAQPTTSAVTTEDRISNSSTMGVGWLEWELSTDEAHANACAHSVERARQVGFVRTRLSWGF
jgi:hypothetical protein